MCGMIHAIVRLFSIITLAHFLATGGCVGLTEQVCVSVSMCVRVCVNVSGNVCARSQRETGTAPRSAGTKWRARKAASRDL